MCCICSLKSFAIYLCKNDIVFYRCVSRIYTRGMWNCWSIWPASGPVVVTVRMKPLAALKNCKRLDGCHGNFSGMRKDRSEKPVYNYKRSFDLIARVIQYM